MGPRPYQCGLPSLMVTGEKQRWPTTRPACSATSDRLSAPAWRKAHDQLFVVIGMGGIEERATVSASMAS